MTIANLSKLILPLGLAFVGLVPQTLSAAEYAITYEEAMGKAGDDGVIVFCYGPDWNRRSVRMLKSFWERPELQDAAGDAILLSVPFYQTPPTEEDLKDVKYPPNVIRGRMQAPPFQICPTVMMFDSSGRLYATLSGTDALGDELGDLGIANIKKNLELLRKQQQLMLQIEEMPAGAERSKLLVEVSELGIAVPSDVASKLQEADDEESKAMQRRVNYKALDFMYEQLETTDGFLPPDFIEDVNKIKDACMEIVEDETLRTMDRQAAYNLYLGAMRRDAVTGARFRAQINRNLKIDEESFYGKTMPHIVKLWPSMKHPRKTSEDRKAARERESEKKKNDRKQGQSEKDISFD